MRKFAEEYPDFEIVQVPHAKNNWYHNITLLQNAPMKKYGFGMPNKPQKMAGQEMRWCIK